MYQIDLSKIVSEAGELSKTSIELAEAASNLGALKVFFGVAMMMFVILGIVAGYSLWNLNHKIISISEASSQVMKYFSVLSNKTIGKEEAKAITREALDKMSDLSKYWILRTRWENNLSKEEETKHKIERIVENSALEFCQLMSYFICNDRPLSNIVEFTDKSALLQMMIIYVYKDKDEFTPSQMSADLDIYFRGLKINYQNNIDRA